MKKEVINLSKPTSLPPNERNKHIHKFYPTSKWEYLTVFDKILANNYQGTMKELTINDNPIKVKWMCECGKIKWVKESEE